MKEYVKITFKDNADAIFCGAKRYDFFQRSWNLHCGDKVTYAVFEDMSKIKHPIERRTYEITAVEDDIPMIVAEDIIVAGFREVRSR